MSLLVDVLGRTTPSCGSSEQRCSEDGSEEGFKFQSPETLSEGDLQWVSPWSLKMRSGEEEWRMRHRNSKIQQVKTKVSVGSEKGGRGDGCTTACVDWSCVSDFNEDSRCVHPIVSNRGGWNHPRILTLNHIPLNPGILLELNGVRSSMYPDGLSSVLRRDLVDKKSRETTFVSTDSIRLSGSMKFDVYDKEECILSGVLETSNSNGFTGESNFNLKGWSMSCESDVTAGTGFLKMKNVTSPEITNPTIEVYVAGCFSGTPIILMELNFRKKQNGRCLLDAIPEYETTDCQRNVTDRLDMQVADFRSFKPENEGDYSSMYWQGTGYIDGEDRQLSWFNAGVRVGVGIGLGICLGVGVGVGLLARSYRPSQAPYIAIC